MASLLRYLQRLKVSPAFLHFISSAIFIALTVNLQVWQVEHRQRMTAEMFGMLEPGPKSDLAKFGRY